jgi:glucokinase
MADGHLIRGSSDIAGSVGWLALNQPFEDKYKPCGCFEYHASGDGLSKVALEYLRQNRNSTSLLTSVAPEEMTAKEIFDAFEKHDPLAISVIKQAVTYWGMAVANLVSLFNPEKIIFGGGVFGPAVILLDDILEEAKKWAQPVSIRQVKLVPSALGIGAGLTGAACLAFSGINKNK